MAAIVLAGGLSRRMGRDKALIQFEGESLLERAVRCVEDVSQPVIIVADRPDKYEIGRLKVVGDETPGAGPLGGIVTGLRHAGPGAHVVLACDMPFVREEVLWLLLESAQGSDAAVPSIGGQLEPLCAVYDYRCVGPFELALNEGCRAVHKALERVTFHRVEEPVLRKVDPDLISFRNLNEPEDLCPTIA